MLLLKSKMSAHIEGLCNHRCQVTDDLNCCGVTTGTVDVTTEQPAEAPSAIYFDRRIL